MALIDVGLKSEGRVALKEFAAPGQPSDLKIGDVVDVYVERLEDKNGEAMLSREKARREEAWTLHEKSFTDNQQVQGETLGRVNGGITVGLSVRKRVGSGKRVSIRVNLGGTRNI